MVSPRATPGTSLVESQALLKGVLRDGSLQEKPGPSIATEFGVLLPGINDQHGTGAVLNGIVSQRWDWGTVHLNAQIALTREQHADYFPDTIIEGPHDWPMRPVGEFFYESDVSLFRTGSALVGAIWQSKTISRSISGFAALHREWFQRSALADLLGEDAGLAEIHKLYRCHDRLLSHKQAVFDHLVGRWRDLFNINYDVLLYDLTSTYFEADPPFPEGDKRRFEYSRDHRPGCVQIVIALVMTPDGLPLAYEVLPGNTSDKTTLRPFLEQIERQYGKARRVG
jgi:hypothetical protein